LCATLLLWAAHAWAQVDVDRLKLSYTLHFISMIQWEKTDGPRREITVCSFPETRFGRQMLTVFEEKAIAGQPVRTRGLALNNPQLASCDLLFIPESLAAFAPSLLERTSSAPMLTISDINGFVGKGGIIGFVIEGDRLRFDIDAQLASRQGIRISAKLLELARQVHR